MQNMEAEMQAVGEAISLVKEKVKDTALEVERLRIERAEAEKEVKRCKAEEEDERVVGLYDWYIFRSSKLCDRNN